MKLLVIGSGGREHALAWKMAQSDRVQVVYVAPGNGGTAQHPRLQNVQITVPQSLVDFARDEKIAFTVVGPEAPLADGLVDLFRANGLRIFGPTQAAAQLESSKAFAKRFMQAHGIPTARYAVFEDAASAREYITQQGAPIVVKADGLAAGKGVVVAETVDQAHAAVDGALSIAGGRVVIEEFMQGEEASFIVLCDGKHATALASSQDHKRLRDGDLGPNTGGMGAYSPAPVVTPEVHARTMREIINPTLRAMAAAGTPFTGFLYAGLMIDAQGKARVVEFNARLGDPETQPILMRMRSDLVDVIEAALDGKLADLEIEWDRRTALAVVVAAHNYPETPRKGDLISLPADTEHATIFHAGTKLVDGGLTSDGGRVLAVTALGDNVRIAQQRAYELADQIRLDGAQFRRDIGHRALGRKA